MTVEVSTVNYQLNNLTKHSKNLEEKKRNEIDATAEAVAALVDDLAAGWERLGLSGREADVAAYRQLGFTNKATAYMLELSPSTVNEYTRRANEKIERAKKLVTHAEQTQAFQKDWSCGRGNTDARRSRADIELDVENRQLTYLCRDNWETHSRSVYTAPK